MDGFAIRFVKGYNVEADQRPTCVCKCRCGRWFFDQLGLAKHGETCGPDYCPSCARVWADCVCGWDAEDA